MKQRPNRRIIENYLRLKGVKYHKLWYLRNRNKSNGIYPLGYYIVEVVDNGFVKYSNLEFKVFNDCIKVYDNLTLKCIDTIYY